MSKHMFRMRLSCGYKVPDNEIDTLDVEIFAYIRTNDYPEYWAIREDINLRIIDIVNDSGTGIAFPSQTTYLTQDTGLDAEKTRQSEAEVESWRAEHNLPFPDFEPEDKEKLPDQLAYPPAGSPQLPQSDKRHQHSKNWKWKRHQRPKEDS